MYTLGVKVHFNAAHFLRNYKGKCASLHGHRWEVEVQVETGGLDPAGMGFDFGKFKIVLRRITDAFDHTCLNDLPFFKHLNPTAENIARTIYDELKRALKRPALKIREVRVWESPEAWAAYAPDEK